MTGQLFTVGPYELAADLYYDPATHLWVGFGAANARFGLDPLGSVTSGDVVAVSFLPAGTAVRRGDAFGHLEAAKFVGPLVAPLSGRIVHRNEAVLANPSLVNDDPLGAWLVEIEPSDAAAELALLLHGRDRVGAWFAEEIERWKQRGAIAE